MLTAPSSGGPVVRSEEKAFVLYIFLLGEFIRPVWELIYAVAAAVTPVRPSSADIRT